MKVLFGVKNCMLVTVVALLVMGLAMSVSAETIIPELAPYTGKTSNLINADTIKGKVMAGYQGWFSAVGDGVDNRWIHWSNNREKVTAKSLLVEMWPDMSEYPESEKMKVEGMKHKDGSQAYLFSSKRAATVDLHFKWMKEYGIDGVFVQRFVCGCSEPNSFGTTGVLALCRNAANKYGRAFSITYDLSGTPADKVFDMTVRDWKFLVDEMKITQDKRYLHEGGKPVLEIYGFFEERFSAETANKLIDFFKNDPKYGTFLIGSGAWGWRTIENPEWAKVYRRFDAYKPWNVGNTMMSPEDGRLMAATHYWEEDVKEAHKHGMMYMPVIYPGFAWDNLMRAYNQPQNVGHSISRRGGAFYWEQFVTATEVKADTIFLAMFDEVDEGTAIFKVTNDPPVNAYFATYEGKPSDWYLRLAGYGTRMFRGKVPLQKTLPEKP